VVESPIVDKGAHAFVRQWQELPIRSKSEQALLPGSNGGLGYVDSHEHGSIRTAASLKKFEQVSLATSDLDHQTSGIQVEAFSDALELPLEDFSCSFLLPGDVEQILADLILPLPLETAELIRLGTLGEFLVVVLQVGGFPSWNRPAERRRVSAIRSSDGVVRPATTITSAISCRSTKGRIPRASASSLPSQT
jgi:hypothetical protein